MGKFRAVMVVALRRRRDGDGRMVCWGFVFALCFGGGGGYMLLEECWCSLCAGDINLESDGGEVAANHQIYSPCTRDDCYCRLKKASRSTICSSLFILMYRCSCIPKPC